MPASEASFDAATAILWQDQAVRASRKTDFTWHSSQSFCWRPAEQRFRDPL
jgi:hypothetical protein